MGWSSGYSRFEYNSLEYNGVSAGYRVDGPYATVKGNLFTGQCYGMIQNDGSAVQTSATAQTGALIEDNWAADSPKGAFRHPQQPTPC